LDRHHLVADQAIAQLVERDRLRVGAVRSLLVDRQLHVDEQVLGDLRLDHEAVEILEEQGPGDGPTERDRRDRACGLRAFRGCAKAAGKRDIRPRERQRLEQPDPDHPIRAHDAAADLIDLLVGNRAGLGRQGRRGGDRRRQGKCKAMDISDHRAAPQMSLRSARAHMLRWAPSMAFCMSLTPCLLYSSATRHCSAVRQVRLWLTSEPVFISRLQISRSRLPPFSAAPATAPTDTSTAALITNFSIALVSHPRLDAGTRESISPSAAGGNAPKSNTSA